MNSEFKKFLEYESVGKWYLNIPWIPDWILDILASRVARRAEKKYKRYLEFKELEQQLQEIARQ